MNRPKRTRNRAVTIRMNDAEYETLRERVSESGLSQQTFVNRAISGATISSSDEVAALKEISKTFADLERQLRGLATNVNQLAHIANGKGIIPTEQQLERLSILLNHYRKESETVWQSIRSSIGKHPPTAQ